MTVGKLLSQGGWAMWPIYLCSVIALVLFWQRFFFYRSIQAKSLPWLDGVFHNLRLYEIQKAQELCENQSHPIARVLACALRVHHVRPDRTAAEAERQGKVELQRYERMLPALAFIAQVAPLLGLLGTVLGMVKMFYGLQATNMANVNASALSSGIWQALLTTAAGLIVAAPTLAAHLYLSNRVEEFRAQLSDSVEKFLTILPPAQDFDGSGLYGNIEQEVMPVSSPKLQPTVEERGRV